MKLVTSESGWNCNVSFTNTTPVPFDKLVFAVAVPKAMNVTMDALFPSSIPPLGT